MKTALAALLMLMPLTISCGSGSRNNTPGSFSGNWQMSLTNANTGTVKSESGFLVQSGNVLAGGVLLAGGSACPGVGSAQGQVSGSNVQLTINQVGETVNLSGAGASNGGQITGNYSIFASPCGVNQYGSWTANQVRTLTGNLTGTFTSTAAGGLATHFTGSITQGPNSASSSTTLSGSLSSTDSACLSNGTISGQISGTAVIFNLLSSEGISLGQYVGKTTLDASQITGTYTLYPQSTGGCQDSGNASFAVH